MNDVPLIQKADINSINTSIIAIKKQLKQLNEALGLVDVPSIDTSVFVKKSDVVDVVESGNMNPVTSNAVVPVDEVTSGNMHSVTSNAVYGYVHTRNPRQWFNFSNNSGSVKYYKINNLLPKSDGEVLYTIQSRGGELLFVSCGHGDGSSVQVPKVKRLLNAYSKVVGLRYSGQTLYMQINSYSHEIVVTRLVGSWYAELSLAETSSSEYSSATAITIE